MTASDTGSDARIGALIVAIGSFGVLITSLLYAASPLQAALPVMPLDLHAAAGGAVRGAGTLHAAGAIGILADVLVTIGGLMLGIHQLRRGSALSGAGWLFIALSTIHFTIVDAVAGFVLMPVAAASGASPAFLAVKTLFDVLFALGTATFGAGAVLVSVRDALASGPLPRWLALLTFAFGFASLAGGLGNLPGLPLYGAMAAGILGGSACFGFIGTKFFLSARTGELAAARKGVAG
jgi:hypothetical protein